MAAGTEACEEGCVGLLRGSAERNSSVKGVDVVRSRLGLQDPSILAPSSWLSSVTSELRNTRSIEDAVRICVCWHTCDVFANG